MENAISQKRSFTNNSNGGFITSQRFAYDDVFNGPPKLGPPTLAPRLEDYTEIFNGFHSSRSSSIPILDVPLMIGDDSFDDSLSFDYSEVFGECKGFDWTASFQDVVGQSSAGYDSSDEPWSPAKSGSLSDELDPVAASDKSYRWSDEDSHRSLQNKRQVNVSYNRSGQKTVETVLAGASPVTNFGEDELCSVYGSEDVQHKKSLYNPLESGCYVHEDDDNLSELRCSDTSSMDRPFMTISDISLRTKPCRVPPPSRPPPALAVKKGSNSILKASKSYAFERAADTTTPLFFDVEVDGSLYVDGMKDVNLKQTCSKGSKKRVDSWDDSKWHLEEVMKEDEKVNRTTDSYTSFEGGKLLQTPEKEFIITGPVAWREEKEYFEVIEKDISMEPFESVAIPNVPMEVQSAKTPKSLPTTESEASEENEDHKKFSVKESLRKDNRRNQLDMARDNYDLGSQHRRERTETMLGDKKEFRAKVMPGKLVTVNTIMSDLDQRDGESKKLQADLDETEANLKQNPLFKIDQRFADTQILQNHNRKPKKYIVRNEYQRRFNNLGNAEIGVGVKQNGISQKENANELEESHMSEEDERTAKDANKHGESGNSYSAVDREGVGEQIYFVGDRDKEVLMEVVADKSNELKFSSAFKDLALERSEERNGDAPSREDNHSGVEKDEIGQGMNLRADAGVVLPSEDATDSEPIEVSVRPVQWVNESYVPVEGDHSQVIDNPQYEAAAKVAGNVENPQNLEKGNMKLKIEPNRSVYESEAGSVDPLVLGKFKNVISDEDEQQEENTKSLTNNKSEECIRPTCIMPDKIASPMGYSHEIDKNILAEDNQEQMMKRTRVSVEEVETRDSQVVNGSRVENPSSVSKCNKDQQLSSKILLNQSVERKDKNEQHLCKNAPNQNIGRKDKNSKDNFVAKDQKVGNRIRRDIELENEHLRRIEEEREREREREKDRMAVDKAAFEAYEISHVEAREKAERAAVERATTEARQRAMAVARERLEKTSMEARQRAERAAVDRATAEARQRAVERSKADKAVYERSINDRFSVPSRSADTNQSFVSSNIQFQDQGLASGLRHPADVGTEGESPQRCKARLERYRRTAERAANALAEKNKRDHLAQKEKEEMNRVAETLDAEVKRWSRGKEGNLRALLSTLQYILGPNSGWQPVPLTEVITSAAVKKAYRKATLCVHPDKLQQRGATIHQKYTCEKVFDLLKAAWNKFNSEER